MGAIFFMTFRHFGKPDRIFFPVFFLDLSAYFHILFDLKGKCNEKFAL
ncbi:hypothetical protein BACCOPRO_00886 [Phocaeicola coprophilus DSM 18228 = JCM 13818]|uniref:Uncharacterized protein n=1 Tax=Phocaeicola coprophilus DSM 18228 = JCM 13818 TaxID=547042 RepID=S0F6U4_9BACT|nr:hypothetical protein BACCOPRO_00886 [Phocaeicola coprophilus DSM 18228 = JCM 13818]